MKTAAKQASSNEGTVGDLLKPYFGKSAYQIADSLGLEIKRTAKDYCARVTSKILEPLGNTKSSVNLNGACMIKTIRVNDAGMPAQDIALPPFHYIELLNENWKTSAL